MSSTEPSANTLKPPYSKRDIDSTYNLGAENFSKEASPVRRSSLKAGAPSKVDSGQQRSQTLGDLDHGDQIPCRVEQGVAGMEGFDKTMELERRAESTSKSPEPALSRADKAGSQDAEGDDFPKGPSYEGMKDDLYLDPTPKTPRLETSPSRNPAIAAETQDDGSTSEIQSIMDQFDEANDNTAGDGTGQPILGTEKSHLGSLMEHPPRRSSLEPLRPSGQQLAGDHASDLEARGQKVPSFEDGIRAPPMRTSSLPQSAWLQDTNTPSSPNSSMSLPKLPPPEPDPEPDLPFDFHRFLEQLRHRTADPVAKFLRSFLIEFGKKQWMVHEQDKIINDFLTFITNKMAQCEVWRGVSDAEFDNAKEGMEKLVMNRLYSQTFSPAIPAPAPALIAKGKRKAVERAIGPGRKGQHQEDIERDEILAQKVRIYGWVQEKHLDIPPIGDNGRRFLMLAQQELLKIKTYRAPRDKIICVLNCCKVIFGLLRNSKASDTSADSFVPLLIYVVLHANPDHLVSNVQYILRFRNQDKLGGEAGYYLSSLMGAIQFIENLDRTSLTISDEDFENNVEAAVSVIAERHEEVEIPPSPPPRHPTHPQISEKSGLSQPEVVPRNSIEAEYSTPRRPTSSRDYSRSLTGNDGSDDHTAVSGLLRTIQRPLSSLGRMFSDDVSNPQQPGTRAQPGPAFQPNPTQRLSPAVFQPPRNSNDMIRPSEEPRAVEKSGRSRERKLSAEDAAARQASAESAEAQRIQRAEHQDVVETLAGMFPDLDKDIINDVVRVKQGRVGLAVDACLALNQ
ncbi:hypothetical protein HO173_007406 [Letharia columbiana]|uniref:Guanine nucleotide exchange factor Vps9 n=1 Tax=Letharia columbiana TaxID=112416 RepID=A0A8H6FTG3_9LECA|nr:uncharacterized protein HO173_007406 [Letharia columbiana]KAF6234373.1 hypothetical protein HO173_007406 [Letharia columbiana]